MKHAGIACRMLGLAAGIVGLLAGTAQAATATTAVDTSACPAQQLSQPFLFANDSDWYTLAPGEQADDFVGTGWQLSGGARLVTTTLSDGSTGTVLDMPSGATAVSPVMCVSSSYPRARTMVRDLVGSEGVYVYDSYETTRGWSNPQNLGQVHSPNTAWAASDTIDIHSSSVQTTTPVQFKFKAGGKTSHFQIYNFYVDPHCFR